MDNERLPPCVGSASFRRNKIKGCIFGHALGDAIGAPLEFRSKKGIADNHVTRDNFDFPLPSHLKFNHKLDSENDWTDDTDHLILVMLSLMENNNQINKIDIAKKIHHWKSHGFEELGDIIGRGCGGTIGNLCEHPKFLIDPTFAASTHKSCSNGALMRTSILSLTNKPYNETMKDVIRLCSVTHTERRVIVSCLVINTILFNVLNETDFNYLRFKKILKTQKEKDDFDKYTLFTKLDELELDGKDKNGYVHNTIGYCFKMMGCAIYAYQHLDKGYRDVLLDIIMMGGDVDTNACVAGAILGCHYGLTHLPHVWLNKLKELPFLETKSNEFVDFLEKNRG